MADKNYRAILIRNRPLGCRDVIGQRGKWILGGMTLAQLDPSAKAPWTNTKFFTVGAAAASPADRVLANNGMIAAVKVSPRTA